MPDLSRILSASTPLTLSSLPRGAQPLVLADLARAAKGRAVFIAPDDAAMRSVAEAARFVAPEVEVLEFPELGMEAVWKIEVEDFPAFIVVDDKGNDFFQQVRAEAATRAVSVGIG